MRTMYRGLVPAVVLLLGVAAEARAGFQVGSSYRADFINVPTTGGTDVTLDLTTKLVNTNLTVTERLFADGPDSQWIELAFDTVNGGPLANNFGGLWRLDVSGLDTTAPAFGSGFYFYWTVNGTPVSNIRPFGGIGGVAPIPTDPTAGLAYTALGFPPFGPLSEFSSFIFVSPYNLVRSGGIDPATANGFRAGIRITTPAAPAVPAPASGLMLAVGTVGAVLFRRGGRALKTPAPGGR